jgi:hypothetical protein
MEKQAHRPSNSGNENNNTTTGNGSPWSLQRLRVTHEDEDGDFLWTLPPVISSTSNASFSTSHPATNNNTTGRNQTAGQKPVRARHVPLMCTACTVYLSGCSYHNVNHALRQLHQERMERERRQAALQNQLTSRCCSSSSSSSYERWVSCCK